MDGASESEHRFLFFFRHQTVIPSNKGPVIRVTFLHCKLKPSAARITTFVTDVSRSKIHGGTEN